MCAFTIVLLLTVGQDSKPPVPAGKTLTILTPKRVEAIFVSESDRWVHIRMKTRKLSKSAFTPMTRS